MIKKDIDRKNYRITSRVSSVKLSDKKIRAFTKNIVGKKISTLLSMLTVQSNNTAALILKLIKSTIRSTHFKEISIEKAFLRQVSVDKGHCRKKIFTRSQGRTNYIRKKKHLMFL